MRIIPLFIMLIPLLDFLASLNLETSIFSYGERILFFLAAVCLLVRHKVTWAMGLLFLFSLIALMTKNLFFADMEGFDLGASAKLVWTVFGVLVLAIVAVCFRYPYLDRRQKWLGPTADRFLVKTPVLVNGSSEGVTVDLSYNGAKIVLAQEMKVQTGDRVFVQLREVSDLECAGEVIGVEGLSLRVTFSPITGESRDLLRQWLMSQDLTKI